MPLVPRGTHRSKDPFGILIDHSLWECPLHQAHHSRSFKRIIHCRAITGAKNHRIKSSCRPSSNTTPVSVNSEIPGNTLRSFFDEFHRSNVEQRNPVVLLYLCERTIGQFLQTVFGNVACKKTYHRLVSKNRQPLPAGGIANTKRQDRNAENISRYYIHRTVH